MEVQDQLVGYIHKRMNALVDIDEELSRQIWLDTARELMALGKLYPEDRDPGYAPLPAATLVVAAYLQKVCPECWRRRASGRVFCAGCEAKGLAE